MKTILKFTTISAFLLILAGGVACCKDKPNINIPDIECYDVLGWAVRLTLKPQADENYLATEDPKIIALVLKHDVEFYQTYAGSTTPELRLYYTLAGKECDNVKNIVKEFLATGKFEADFYVYGIADPL